MKTLNNEPIELIDSPRWEDLFNFKETHGIEKQYNFVDQELKVVQFWGGSEIIKKLFNYV